MQREMTVEQMAAWGELMEQARQTIETERREITALRLKLLHEREAHEALKAWIREGRS